MKYGTLLLASTGNLFYCQARSKPVRSKSFKNKLEDVIPGPANSIGAPKM